MKFLSVMLLSIFLNTAYSAEMRCLGVTNSGARHSVNFNFNEMTVSINGEKHSITSSSRSNTYMKGTQFLEMSSVAGAKFKGVRSKILWASYYSTGTQFDNSISFVDTETGEDESAWLSCNPALYNGPTLFQK